MFTRVLPLLISGVCCTYASAQPIVRFFFDTNGVGEQEDRGVGDLNFENPMVDGASRLYLYGQFVSSDELQYIGIGLDIEVTGGGEITSWNFYNHFVPNRGPRWHTVTPDPGSGNRTLLDDIGMNAMSRFGMQNGFLAHAYDTLHYRVSDEDYGNTLLGYIDVTGNGSAYSEVRLGVGDAGMVWLNQNETAHVYFGFGDEDTVITGIDFGMQSPLADAVIIPEPATATALLVLAVACAGFSRRVA
jgi:hypothetical protein